MIKCENLSAGYGSRAVITDINWQAEPGKLTAIIGPNGSGKSTLLKAVMGQAKVISGGIFLEEKPIEEFAGRERAKRIAYLPQSRSDANISAARMVLHGRFPYIVYPRHYTGEDEAKVEEALSALGITDLRDKPVSELSGGEKQKVYLAMALVQDAPVLFLDEPATYLDISGQLELLEQLKGLAERGRTIVVVLHDLNQALQYADRILVMEKGQLVQYGSGEEIMEAQTIQKVFHIQVRQMQDEEGQVHYWFLGGK